MQEEDAVEHAGRGRQRRALPLDSQAPRLGQAAGASVESDSESAVKARSLVGLMQLVHAVDF